MNFFKRKKIKLSLIDDYIKILLIENFFNNPFESINCSKLFFETKNLSQTLKNKYDNLLNQLKLNDLSLLILKKELKENNNLYQHEKTHNFTSLEKTLFQTKFKLDEISNNLTNKIKRLKVSAV